MNAMGLDNSVSKVTGCGRTAGIFVFTIKFGLTFGVLPSLSLGSSLSGKVAKA